jgi:hypothetical protein
VRRALALLSCVLLLATTSRGAHGQPEPPVLLGPSDVQGLRRADVNGDGITDLLLLEGRRVRVWMGAKGRLPSGAPPFTWDLPPAVTFVDVLPGPGDLPHLLTLGTDGVHLRPETAPGRPYLPGHALAWRDAERAVFADLVHGEGLLLPDADGWTLTRPGAKPPETIRLQLTPSRSLDPPGPFLEDTADVVHALPAVYVGAPATGGSKEHTALWALDGRTLVAQTATRRVRYDLSFLSAGENEQFDQTLVDLDGDRRPEVLHRIYTNREVRYGFFRTKPAAPGATAGPSHLPAACTLYLQGFQLEPSFVDLDGDGRLDLVVTSMQVNAANMLSALTSGKVTAETRAFLNRSGRGGGYFDREPDALVSSQIEVRVQFNQAGNVEVVRSLLIVLDGDYDGDGRKDLAIRTGPATLDVHPGTATGVWSPKARHVAIPPMGNHPDVEGYAADVDGDGRDEMVLVYRKAPGGRDEVRVVEP